MYYLINKIKDLQIKLLSLFNISEQNEDEIKIFLQIKLVFFVNKMHFNNTNNKYILLMCP